MTSTIFTRSSSLDNVPSDDLFRMAIRLYLLGALVWDYTDTVLDIAAQMRVSATRPLARAVRALHMDYDHIRARDLDSAHINKEWQLATLFEQVTAPCLSTLNRPLRREIQARFTLEADNLMLVQAVYVALTMLDAMRLYASHCDAFIHRYHPRAAHSILPDHFARLAVLLPQFAGDCQYSGSDARRVAARAILDDILSIELSDDESTAHTAATIA